eukprot:TRINITY_DN13222_c0_g1_i2.p3 TRINITY_DN13222_c0_g1~~TRINITY_DN13222_c0_g1_i2.p3  ORF type:complete len:111 (+),score=17.42 TRINITY_DN13222_c0_g1_i2:182-514(+)
MCIRDRVSTQSTGESSELHGSNTQPSVAMAYRYTGSSYGRPSGYTSAYSNPPTYSSRYTGRYGASDPYANSAAAGYGASQRVPAPAGQEPSLRDRYRTCLLYTSPSPRDS